MTLFERIEAEFRQAMKAGDASRRMVLSLVKSALHNRAIEKRKKDATLSDDEVEDVILTELKRRRDSAAQYKTAGRDDLVKKEEEEAAVLVQFLPPQLSDAELRALVKGAVAASGALAVKDTGKVLAVLAKQLKGKADMSAVVQIVKEQLSG